MAERAKFVRPKVVPETAASSNLGRQGGECVVCRDVYEKIVLDSWEDEGGSAGPLIPALKN